MKQITKTLRTFGEMIEANKAGVVSNKAVERAHDWMVEGLQQFEWWDQTYDVWKEALAQIGFDDATITFSGFWSQGDGASFTCSRVDLSALVAFMAADIKPSEVIDGNPEDFKPWLVFKAKGKSPANRKYKRIPVDQLSAVVERTSHHYSHENTCRFSIDGCYGHSRIDKLIASFESDVEQLRRDLCRALYKDLEEEYEHQTSDDELIDAAEANQYTFDEMGRREG